MLKNDLIMNNNVPTLILLNKIDLVNKIEKEKLDHVYKNIDYSLLKQKHFLVKDISALKNIHLDESLRWLFNSITDEEKKK